MIQLIMESHLNKLLTLLTEIVGLSLTNVAIGITIYNVPI